MANNNRGLFAVCSTCSLAADVLNKFLEEAQRGVELIIPDPNAPRRFVLFRDLQEPKEKATPTIPPVLDLKESLFEGSTLQEVAEQLRRLDVLNLDRNYFVILDRRSTRDSTALLVAYEGERYKSVRAEFAAAESLMALQTGTLDMDDLIESSIASGGIYREATIEDNGPTGTGPTLASSNS